MGDLIQMDDYRTGWLSGIAKCFQCGHNWVAVCPTGTTPWIQCPNCEAMKGFLIHPVEKEGEHWTCECGCDVFHLTRLGPYCPVCGSWHDDYLETIE